MDALLASVGLAGFLVGTTYTVRCVGIIEERRASLQQAAVTRVAQSFYALLVANTLMGFVLVLIAWTPQIAATPAALKTQLVAGCLVYGTTPVWLYFGVLMRD